MRHEHTRQTLLSYLAPDTTADDTTVAMTARTTSISAGEPVLAAVKDFCDLEGWNGPSELLYTAFNARFHDLLLATAQAEMDGVPYEKLRAWLVPARAIVGQAPFVRRLQEWPRGYPGDFETIELMDITAPSAPLATLADCAQAWALRCPPTEQHRNKLRAQAAFIRRHVTDRSSASIVLVACGGCADAAQITDALHASNCRLVVNDIDPDALELAKRRLKLNERLETVAGSATRLSRRLASCGPHDAIVVGGLLDYLSDAQARSLLTNLGRGLKPNGRLMCTNIASGNPYRTCMEYIVDWRLTERSRTDLEQLLVSSNLSVTSLQRDRSGLAWLAEAAPIAVSK